MHVKFHVLAFVVLIVIPVSGCVDYPVSSGKVFQVSNDTVYGTLYMDQTWSGTIHVIGDVNVPEHVTLNITPGTIIMVRANSDIMHTGGEHIIDELTADDPSATEDYTHSHITFNINGRLFAVGTPDNMITFTSDAEQPSHTDWDGITYLPTSSGEMRHCLVEWTHTGPSLYGTDKVNITHCEIRHIFWGGLHAFLNSPVFEYNTLDDIGHEAFDTHKASPVIRYNEISHARSAVVFNNYNTNTGKPVVFESNIVRDSGSMGMLQENARAIIRNNTFIGSDDTGGPWTYRDYVLEASVHSESLHIADNADVVVENNSFSGIMGDAITYELTGPNMGTGHTTNEPEFFEIGDNPVSIIIRNNNFESTEDKQSLAEMQAMWENVAVSGNSFG